VTQQALDDELAVGQIDSDQWSAQGHGIMAAQEVLMNADKW
jgi:hypothetical protein